MTGIESAGMILQVIFLNEGNSGKIDESTGKTLETRS